MAALGCVDMVTWFDGHALQRILDCRPDVLVKGGDWAPEHRRRRRGRGWGGSVHSIPFIHQTSTTLLDKIRRL